MTTITAVNLRKDLDSILKRAAKGERIRVTYRGNTAVTIGPDTQGKVTNSATIVRKAKAISAKVSQPVKDAYSTDQSVKQLIKDHRTQKYGQ